MTSKLGFFVDVSAGINNGTGEASWTLTAIDPNTGEELTDASKGFLPPDDQNGSGEGFVSYSVRSRQDATTGNVINAQARIVFDNNPPIDTPTISNTIDAVAPSSTVEALPATEEDNKFLVSWSGNDNPGGSGLADFTIYVSDNAEAATPWLSNTTLTAATYIGQAGHSYAFYSIAQDNAGNIQDTPATAQASTTVAGGGTLAFSAPTFSVNEDGTPIAAVTVTRTNGSNGTVGATLGLTDGTATAPLDYNNAPINLSFADGETSKTVTIPVINNHILEGDTTINLSLTNPTGGATLGTQDTATLTIKNNNYIIDLGTLGGTSGQVQGINSSAQVVGSLALASGATHALLFADTNGNHQVDTNELQDLGTLGGASSHGTGIDDNGHVVGYSSFNSNGKVRHAFITNGLSMSDLGTLGGTNSQATASKNNQVVGYSTTSNGQTHAFLFPDTNGNGQKDPGENLVDLSTVANPITGTYSQATGVNTQGDITGSTNANSVQSQVFYWDPVTGMKVIGTLGGNFSQATGINDQNQVVGYAQNSNGSTHGFIWDSTHGIQDLGSLGSDYSQALGVNNKGQVVGTSLTSGSGESHAFLWQNGKMTDLNSLLGPNSGWDLYSATGINNSGQIIGYGLINGQQHSFLLSAGLG